MNHFGARHFGAHHFSARHIGGVPQVQEIVITGGPGPDGGEALRLAAMRKQDDEAILHVLMQFVTRGMSE